MSKHKPGDMVRVNCQEGQAHGQEVVVLSCLKEVRHLGRRISGHQVSWRNKFKLGVALYGPWCIYEPHELIPISRLTVDELADAKEVA